MPHARSSSCFTPGQTADYLYYSKLFFKKKPLGEDFQKNLPGRRSFQPPILDMLVKRERTLPDAFQRAVVREVLHELPQRDDGRVVV